ncbi:CoA transferase [Streptomyces sp. NPDC096152]|uniref:CoA transferase n=1 Tax=Streptomyces sp. NPDC096152 TaxID=3366078 RepID=UPI0037FC40EE
MRRPAAAPQLYPSAGTGDQAITDWTSRRNLRQALDALTEAGFPAGPVHNATSIVEEPRYLARGTVQEFEVFIDEQVQRVRFPGRSRPAQQSRQSSGSARNWRAHRQAARRNAPHR